MINLLNVRTIINSNQIICSSQFSWAVGERVDRDELKTRDERKGTLALSYLQNLGERCRCRGLFDRPASPADDDHARRWLPEYAWRAAPPQKREEAAAKPVLRDIGPGTGGPTAHAEEKQGPLDRATQVKAGQQRAKLRWTLRRRPRRVHHHHHPPASTLGVAR